MSTLQFDPPIFATHRASGMPVVVMAADFQLSSCVLLYADDEGYLQRCEPEEIRTDWRYDVAEEEWYDAVLRAKEQLADAAGESQDG